MIEGVVGASVVILVLAWLFLRAARDPQDPRHRTRLRMNNRRSILRLPSKRHPGSEAPVVEPGATPAPQVPSSLGDFRIDDRLATRMSQTELAGGARLGGK